MGTIRGAAWPHLCFPHLETRWARSGKPICASNGANVGRCLATQQRRDQCGSHMGRTRGAARARIGYLTLKPDGRDPGNPHVPQSVKLTWNTYDADVDTHSLVAQTGPLSASVPTGISAPIVKVLKPPGSFHRDAPVFPSFASQQKFKKPCLLNRVDLPGPRQ